MEGSPELTLTDNAGEDDTRDTITRSAGSWADDGFEAGHSIAIIGDPNNVVTYTIDGISEDGETLYLATGDSLTGYEDPQSGLSVEHDDWVVMDAENAMDLTLTDNGGMRDLIIRSEGSWVDDGFSQGDEIRLVGDSSNTGVYTIDAISDDELTLYLAVADTLSVSADALSGILVERIEQTSVYMADNVGEVDTEAKTISTFDEREIEYDLLVSIPTNMGSESIERSDIGDELAFIPTDKNTLLSKGWNNVFIIGDATDLPSSKAGSVAHFQGDILEKNVLRAMDGRRLLKDFDGHANCFIESGFNKAVLIDFNYDHEPLPGRFPLPGVGPMSLLAESEANHWGKMAFRWIYWNQLLSGNELPFVDSQMSLMGKWS